LKVRRPWPVRRNPVYARATVQKIARTFMASHLGRISNICRKMARAGESCLKGRETAWPGMALCSDLNLEDTCGVGPQRIRLSCPLSVSSFPGSVSTNRRVVISPSAFVCSSDLKSAHRIVIMRQHSSYWTRVPSTSLPEFPKSAPC
jgi:hypothetical protein